MCKYLFVYVIEIIIQNSRTLSIIGRCCTSVHTKRIYLYTKIKLYTKLITKINIVSCVKSIAFYFGYILDIYYKVSY